MRTFLRCRSKWDKLLFIGIWLLALFPSTMKAQPYIDSVCVLTDYATNNAHAIYLDLLPGTNSRKFLFDANGGQMIVYSDSSIHITGRVVHAVNPTWQWDINMWLINQKDYQTWDSLGRKAKRGAAPFNLFHASKVNFDFYELDSTRTYLSGVPGTFFNGDTLFLTHMPASLEFGFQRGVAANGHTADYGMSGWFFFNGSYSGMGDLNVNISCAPPVCDVAIDSVVTTCLTDSTFGLAVSVSGTGSDLEITDNQGSAPLSGLSAGTYNLGPYSNNTSVNVFASNTLIFACVDSAGPFTEDCTPPCEVSIDSIEAVCISDTTFEIVVNLGGPGTNYELTDDQGSAPLSGLSAGTYVMGPYANNLVVTVIATDLNLTACADTAAPLTLYCSSCNLNIDSIAAVCSTDSTFDVVVMISGSSGGYELGDNQGSPLLTGLSAGTYTFGPYANNTNVFIYANDANLTACVDTAGPVTQDCTPVINCEASLDSVVAVCTSDSTFELIVQFGGTGINYELTDNQGSAPLSGLSAGIYNLGPYPNNANVVVTVTDLDLTACADTAGPFTLYCATCDVNIDSISTVCLTDSTFEVVVTLTGAGSNYSLLDNLGSTPLTGLSAGTYNLGPYANNASVIVFAVDTNLVACVDSAGPVTKDCSPQPVCDVNIDSVAPNCLSDSTFEVIVTISGMAPFYTISDDAGSAPVTVPGAGTYNYGTYSSDSTVNIFVNDTSIANCGDSFGPVSEACDCDVQIDTIFALCISPDSFNIVIAISGFGDNYQIEDSEGNLPLTGLTAGTYFLGPYFNSTDVFVTVSDPTFPGCVSFDGPYTADCTPVQFCAVDIDTAFAICTGPGTFELSVTFTGLFPGSYQISDNLGTPPLGGLSSGTYSYGNYSNGDSVTIYVVDTTLFIFCADSVSKLSAECGPSPFPIKWDISKFYPNPTLGKSYLDIVIPYNSKIDWVMLDSYGNRIADGKEPMNFGENTMSFKTATLASGLYIVELYHMGSFLAARKLIVIH
ncbi:MAG: hypothetical protein KDE26_05865 [Bacteroidetes bacterium]|nr:hypothetical protein [Bacteroidota bacterium]